MPSTNGHVRKLAIPYARVSTEEQARSGYSIPQQLEACRAWCAREGYEILEEVVDPGQSGVSLERPGMDHVRDLVASVGRGDAVELVVVAQDRDRFAREPAYLYLLKTEFAEHETKLRALNDRGDDSPEGEFFDGVMDQLAKLERAKTAQRTRRGKLQKVRKGKLIRNSRPHYGFKYDEAGEGYVVDEEEMSVIRRIFRAVSEGTSFWGVKRSLEVDGVPPPGNGAKARGRHWSATYLRRIIEDDVYKPHGRNSIAGLVAEGLLASEVAALLDESASYGIFWFNRTRTTRKRVSKVSETGDGREYRWTRTVNKNPRSQWIAVPVPNAGVPLEVVEAAREMVRYNQQPASTGRRFWEIPGGAVRCESCNNRMLKYAGMANGKVYAYYKCARLVRNGKDACSPDRLRTNHRAEKLESKVWEVVSGLIKDPERMRIGLERMIDEERANLRGDPDRAAKAWADKLAEVEAERRGYQRLAAKGLMTDEDLEAALSELEDTRKAAERELEATKGHKARIEQLERDRDTILAQYTNIVPEALDALTPEERHTFYKLARLEVFVYPNCDLRIIWAGGQELFFSNQEMVSRYLP